MKRHGKKAMLSIIASVHRWHHGEWSLVNGNDGNQSYHFLALDDISLRLHQSAYTVSYTITNTGNRRGAEVRPLFSDHPGLMLKLSSYASRCLSCTSRIPRMPSNLHPFSKASSACYSIQESPPSCGTISRGTIFLCGIPSNKGGVGHKGQLAS